MLAYSKGALPTVGYLEVKAYLYPHKKVELTVLRVGDAIKVTTKDGWEVDFEKEDFVDMLLIGIRKFTDRGYVRILHRPLKED